MNPAIVIHRTIILLLASMLLASFPILFFLQIGVLVICTTVFLLICIIDFIRKTSLRSPAGLVLGFMYLAEIFSGIMMYGIYCSNAAG